MEAQPPHMTCMPHTWISHEIATLWHRPIISAFKYVCIVFFYRIRLLFIFVHLKAVLEISDIFYIRLEVSLFITRASTSIIQYTCIQHTLGLGPSCRENLCEEKFSLCISLSFRLESYIPYKLTKL